MPTKEEIMAQIQIFKNAKGTLVQDSLVKILEMLCDSGSDQSGRYLKIKSDLPLAEHWTSNAITVVNTQYDLSQYQESLPANCGFGIYLRLGSMPVTDYYFEDNGKKYYRIADYQGEWIISNWQEMEANNP